MYTIIYCWVQLTVGRWRYGRSWSNLDVMKHAVYAGSDHLVTHADKAVPLYGFKNTAVCIFFG